MNKNGDELKFPHHVEEKSELVAKFSFSLSLTLQIIFFLCRRAALTRFVSCTPCLIALSPLEMHLFAAAVAPPGWTLTNFYLFFDRLFAVSIKWQQKYKTKIYSTSQEDNNSAESGKVLFGGREEGVYCAQTCYIRARLP